MTRLHSKILYRTGSGILSACIPQELAPGYPLGFSRETLACLADGDVFDEGTNSIKNHHAPPLAGRARLLAPPFAHRRSIYPFKEL